MAIEYAQRSKRKGFWTPGGETARQTLNSLAPQLGVATAELTDQDIYFQVRRRLQALPSKTLWVIDNLGDIDQLASLFNDVVRISLLVTSRDGR